MTHVGRGRTRKFTIDDAFEEETDDAIRLYGTSAETRPLHQPSQPKYRALEPVVEVDNSCSPKFTGVDVLKSSDSTSVDSESLIGGTSAVDGSSDPDVWWSHPKVQENKKLVICAIVLTVLGAVVLSAGIVIISAPIAGLQGLVFIMAGALFLIPGVYHLAFIYLAVKGRRGYSFRQLPLFN